MVAILILQIVYCVDYASQNSLSWLSYYFLLEEALSSGAANVSDRSIVLVHLYIPHVSFHIEQCQR